MVMITGSKIRLRNKKIDDARDDYTWQTDAELARLDAAPRLTIAFPIYLIDYADELCYPSSARYQFAIETLDGKHIGNCSCYNIDETMSEAELGIMIGDRDYWDKGYGSDAVSTLVNYIFQHTNLQRIYLKTLNHNKRAQECFKKCLFTPYGQSVKDAYSFILMEIHRKQWQKRQTQAIRTIQSQ